MRYLRKTTSTFFLEFLNKGPNRQFLQSEFAIDYGVSRISRSNQAFEKAQ